MHTQPVTTECQNCGSADHSSAGMDGSCPCGCHRTRTRTRLFAGDASRQRAEEYARRTRRPATVRAARYGETVCGLQAEIAVDVARPVRS